MVVSRSVPGSSRTPIASAIADVIDRRSVVGVRSTNQMPSGKRSSTWSSTSNVRRVLPTPPGPVMVTNRASSSRLDTRRRSSMRPTKLVSTGGRGCGAARRVRRVCRCPRDVVHAVVSDTSSATIARSSSRSSSLGSRPSCSPSTRRARWNARRASACCPSRCRATISCAHRCSRNGSARVAEWRSAISAASPPTSKRAALRSSTIARKSSSSRTHAALARPSTRSGAGEPRHNPRALASTSIASSASPCSRARRPATTSSSNSRASTRSAAMR